MDQIVDPPVQGRGETRAERAHTALILAIDLRQPRPIDPIPATAIFTQPINDTAHQTGLAESKFKVGQTIPAKFVIKDAAGNVIQQVGNPTFSRSNNLGSCDTTTAPEAVLELASDAGTQYVWAGSHYHYNWSTKGLTAGEYRIYANLADGGTGRYVDICLTK